MAPLNTEKTTIYKRIVIKIGTNVLTENHKLQRARMLEIVRQCALLYNQGCNVVVCTSAAVAVGRSILAFPTLPDNISSKQLLAAVGQCRLMQTWEQLFDIYSIHVGQILLTRADVENRRRFLNARDALTALIDHRIVPVVNENDAVATEEIRVGDNDNLSALLATLVNADLLLILTDQPGLFTADPRTDSNAKLIPEVHKIDDNLKKLAGDSMSGVGVGGMITKLQAADTARRAGADVIIADGLGTDVVLRAVQGVTIGTRFPAIDSPIESRKRWLLAGATPMGRILVDAGAVRALCHQGKSLLPAGIVDTSGLFERGDIVTICDRQMNEFARGLTSYASKDLQAIKGCRSDQITDHLGYTYGPTVVHRNDMVLLTEKS
ncbi:MAG: glutamate 5-kinase [Chloroflexota bacterium]